MMSKQEPCSSMRFMTCHASILAFDFEVMVKPASYA